MLRVLIIIIIDCSIVEPVRLQPSPRGGPSYNYQMSEQEIKARQQMAHV